MWPSTLCAEWLIPVVLENIRVKNSSEKPWKVQKIILSW